MAASVSLFLFPSARSRVLNTTKRESPEVILFLDKEDMQRIEIKEFVLGCPARREVANLKKTFSGFQGFPLALKGTSHF